MLESRWHNRHCTNSNVNTSDSSGVLVDMEPMTLLGVMTDNTTIVLETLSIIGTFIAVTEWRFRTLMKPIKEKLDDEIEKAEKQHELIFKLLTKGG